MPKILFPTDFSEYAKNAFQYAINLAMKIDAEITTVHVYEKLNIPGIEKMPVTAAEIYENIKLETFEHYRDQIPKYREIAEKMGASSLNINHELEEGEMVYKIRRIATEGNYDFIIMGTKGASGLKEIFLGSNTGEIMEHAPCPVLGIPEEAEFVKVDKIMLTYDFESDTPQLVSTVMTIAEIFEAQVHVLHIDTTHSASYSNKKDELEDMFAGKESVSIHIIDADDIEKALNLYAEQNGIDIICMMTRKRNFFQELFHYSLAKRMSFHSKIPVMSLPVAMMR